MLILSLDSVPDDRGEGYSGWVINDRNAGDPGLVAQGMLSPAQIPIAGGAATVPTTFAKVVAGDFARHAWYSPQSYEQHIGHQRCTVVPFPVAPLKGNQAGLSYIPYRTDGPTAAAHSVANR